MPNFNNIIGDKLTAFAPNTTGIPYLKKDKEMGMEIIKQMYDIGMLFDKIDDVSIVRDVFNLFVLTEAKYRNLKIDSSDVLQDIYNNSLSICLRKSVANSRFDILNNGIKQIKPFIFSEIDDSCLLSTSLKAMISISQMIKINNIEKYHSHR